MWKNTVKLEIQKTQHKKCDLGLTNLTELEEMEAARTAVEADNDNDLRVPCFCEENVWRLAYRLTHRPGIKKGLQYHVVFVSNPVKCVPMFQQLANSNPLDPVYWDYHVILFQTLEADGTRVLDIDSHLPYKLTLCDYLKSVFPNWNQWRKTYLPYFRVIEASTFLRNFASDRSHMINPETKEWNSPPPPYACIRTERSNNNIHKFFTITEQESQSSEKDETSDLGAVYSIHQLIERYNVVIL